MTSFYYDTSKLRKEWSEEALTNYGEYIAEALRSEQLHKDGWCESKLEYFDSDECQIKVRWGLDEEGYKQEWNDTMTYTREDFFKEYDKNFPEKPKGIEFSYMDDEPEEEYSVFGTKI